MKVCLAQINTTPGDFSGNFEAIGAGIDAARAGDADIVLFPELTIPGYLHQDLIYHPSYVDRTLAVLGDVVERTRGIPGLHVVVGYIDRNPEAGKPFRNMAAVIRDGRVVCTYQKQLLPFYDVFDEARYYQPGTELALFEVKGVKVGVTICEDLWNDKGSDDYNYVDNPAEHYRRAGARVLLSLNSSPFVHDKCWQRVRMIASANDPDVTVVYVNQRGGQDELVFDGQSFVVRGGDLVHLSDGVFDDTFDLVDLDQPAAVRGVANQRAAVRAASVRLEDLLVLCLRDYTYKSGFSELVLASSGGVDSAVVCLLAASAVGPDHVHAIRMPSRFSSDHSRADAIQLHEDLGCWDYEVPIDHDPVVEMLSGQYEVHSDSRNLVRRAAGSNLGGVANENIQARLRDLYVMHFSNAYGAMPLSTGNKTESACGYYTHFDMNFSFAPIKDLLKFHVMDIAKAAESVPETIWQKPPSAELRPDQTDEESLLPYAILDPIVKSYVEDYVSTLSGMVEWFERMRDDEVKVTGDVDGLEAWLGDPEALTDHDRVIRLIGRMEYKRRQTCPGTKVSRVAFGTGRRIPIVEKWS